MKYLIALMVLVAGVSGARAELIEKVVAVVNGEAILVSDIEVFRGNLKEGRFVDDLIISDDASRKKALESDSFALDKLIETRLIDSEIKRLGLSATSEQVQKEIARIADRNGLSVDQVEDSLRAQGVSFADYQDFIRRSLERKTLLDREVQSKIKISEEDVASYYLNRTKGTDQNIFEFSLAHIFVSSQKRGAEGARTRANEVLTRMKKGETFEALAADFSEDPNYTDGGRLGVFKMNELTPEFRKALTPLSTGETSGVVQGPSGFHIFKVLDKKVMPNPDLERAKQGIRNELFAQAFKSQFEFWLNQKKAEAFIRINEK